MCLVNVTTCCRVEGSATGRSIVKRSSTECGVSECVCLCMYVCVRVCDWMWSGATITLYTAISRLKSFDWKHSSITQIMFMITSQADWAREMFNKLPCLLYIKIYNFRLLQMFSVVKHNDTFLCLYLHLFTVYLRRYYATANVSGLYWCTVSCKV